MWITSIKPHLQKHSTFSVMIAWHMHVFFDFETNLKTLLLKIQQSKNKAELKGHEADSSNIVRILYVSN